jgi:hypothetical protein
MKLYKNVLGQSRTEIPSMCLPEQRKCSTAQLYLLSFENVIGSPNSIPPFGFCIRRRKRKIYIYNFQVMNHIIL